MKYILFLSALLLSLLSLASCAHQSDSRNSVNVTVAQEVMVQVGDQEPQKQPAGASFLINQPTLISSPGFYPMTVIPAESGRASLQIKLSAIEEKEESKANPQVEANQLLLDTIRVQSLIARKKGSEAVTLVENLQKKWDQVAVLELLKASALIVDGNFQRAKAILEEAIKKNPNNSELKELLLRLNQRKS